MTGPRQFREAFPGGEKAAGHARRVLARWLADAVDGERLGDLQLLVTEIVANCVRHGGVGEEGNIDLQVHVRDSIVRVEVRDTGIQADPRLRTPDLSGGGGFGMVLVERMSRSWGVDHEPNVVMWFEIAVEPPAAQAQAQALHRHPAQRVWHRARRRQGPALFQLRLRVGHLALAQA
jgi:serine/threonine-protein kinase RsbW